MAGKLTWSWRAALSFKLLYGVSIHVINFPFRTKKCRILNILWCIPKILYHPQGHRRITRSGCHSRHHAQRSNVSNDAFDLHASYEISSSTAVHRAGRPLYYYCKSGHVIIRYPSLAAYCKSGCALRYCKWLERSGFAL
jgi:hypothetical protein